jgi:BirA family biotin operon repressor/biotin-[acetyl-CoA-carboxylase] ligase
VEEMKEKGSMKERILDLLRTGGEEPLSGEKISRVLDISRAAVWKHIQALREEGYEIISRPGVGYSLVTMPDKLYPAEVRAALGEKGFFWEIEYHRVLDSTNNRAKELAEGGAPEGTLVLAEEQLGGRGRLGRNWFSPAGKGIYLSFVLRPSLLPQQLAGITMVTAVGVCQSILETTGIRTGIKWPNDLLLEGKKVCGILTEMKGEMDRVHYVIVGVGINVNGDQEDYPEELRERATSLARAAGREIARLPLLVSFLQKFASWYEIFQTKGFSPVRKVWKDLTVTLGKQVTVRSGTEIYIGTAVDLDEGGALVLQEAGGSCRFLHSGEVTLVKSMEGE